MKETNLKAFFNPASVAIIGASRDYTTISGKPLYYLKKHGYKGKIFPINPKYQRIDKLPCFPSIGDVPEPVDLALIAVNYKIVPKVLEDCIKKGVHFATIFSSGFAEAGEEGREAQKRIAELVSQSNIRVCGPNCQGAVDLYNHTAAAFSASLDITPLIPGPLGFVTQSGALGFSIFNLAQESGIGFSYVVSTGNEVDLNCVDFIDFMLDDPNTRMVFAYLEGIRNGNEFIKVADKALDIGKPFVVLKVGRSEVGSRAASSHTAALTGSERVFDALARQKGIIRVNDIEEFIDLPKAMIGISNIPQGKQLGIISTSGGGGVLCADLAADYGLEVVNLQPETVEKIKQTIPNFGSPLNPVDMTAQVINTAEGFSNVLQAMLDDPGVDALVVVITMIVGNPGLQMAKDLARMKSQTAKPIIVVWTAGSRLIKEQLAVLSEASVPCYQSPARAIGALARLMYYGMKVSSKKARSESITNIGADALTIPAEVTELIQGKEGALSEHQSKLLLAAFGIAISREEVATTEEEAVRAAKSIGYPVAVKIDSPDILHKSEAGVIRLNITNESELLKAYREIIKKAKVYDSKARINGVLVQEMIPKGVEVIVGMNRDPQFGPTIMFGLGGIFVEILEDVALRIAPVDVDEARAMIREIRGYKVLTGARGRTKADEGALADMLVKVSRMALTLGPRLAELDINPVIVLEEGQGAKVADALAILGPV